MHAEDYTIPINSNYCTYLLDPKNEMLDETELRKSSFFKFVGKESIKEKPNNLYKNVKIALDISGIEKSPFLVPNCILI